MSHTPYFLEKSKEKYLVINFISFPSEFGSSLYQHSALLRRGGHRETYYVPLFVDSVFTHTCIDDSLIYKRIWSGLESQMKGVHTIFITSSTDFNDLGIEYVKDNYNKYIHEKYDIYRISSLRELSKSKQNPMKMEAVLYGGLNYDYKQKNVNNSYVKKGLCEHIIIPNVFRNKYKTRGGFDFLNNTLEEVEIINRELNSNGIRSKLFTATKGTEESFKALNGKNIGILHISTHGMYIPNEDVYEQKQCNNLSFLVESNMNIMELPEEDDILSRSFLVMSKGNMLIYRDSIAQGIEDGILTATEISKMDLSNVDLVVLSACQTALGEINNDGVYGLQRGFKKAGVNTILMSTDNVDDEATKILMVEFYKNLMGGKSKLQSLKDAQRYLRQFEGGKYDEPKYWASFIMLDGLD